MQELTYENYNKIEDTLLFLGKNTVLKMNLSLYSMSEKIGRSFYHKEIMYYNEKANQKVVNIKRSFDYYMTIEQLKPVNGEKQYIMIRQDDILILRKALNKVYDLFYEKFDEIFIRRGRVIKINKEFKPIEFNGLPLGKFLVFSPSIVDSFSGIPTGCIRMNLSSPVSWVDMPLAKMSGFVETINNADMFLYAQNMANYFGRTPFGTGLYDMTSKQEIVDKTVIPSGRMIGKTEDRKGSYFDNEIKKLEE